MDFNSTRKELEELFYSLCREVLPGVAADWEATDEDPEPFLDVTIGYDINADGEFEWNYQTGDNSYTGGAYGFHNWHTLTISDITCWVSESFDAMSEILGTLSERGYETPLLWRFSSGCGRTNTTDLPADSYYTAAEFIRFLDPRESSEQVSVEFFVTSSQHFLDTLREGDVALIAKLETKQTSLPPNESIVEHYFLGTFSTTLPQDICVSRIMRYAEFALSCVKEDGHFASCPSSERIDWVDRNFNLIPDYEVPHG